MLCPKRLLSFPKKIKLVASGPTACHSVCIDVDGGVSQPRELKERWIGGGVGIGVVLVCAVCRLGMSLFLHLCVEKRDGLKSGSCFFISKHRL